MTSGILTESGSIRRKTAEHLRANAEAIVRRWLERISSRVAVERNEVFPTEELLNHVPLLIDGIADFVERDDLALDSNVPVTAKAMELGALRHGQGFDAYQILKEYELLANIIFSTLRPFVEDESLQATRHEVAVCWEQIGQAVELIRQATVTHYLRLAHEKVAEREGQLRRFNRMVSHELKNRIGALRGAAHMLRETWLSPEEIDRFQMIVLDNSIAAQKVLSNLEALSRLEMDARQRKNVLLPQVAAEAIRQVRETAQANNVTVITVDPLPPVEVDAAAVELCLTNLISNGIKYADRNKPDKWVELSAQLLFPSEEFGELIIKVRDNGIGIPRGAREKVFEHFYRAHPETVTDVDGSGLGLSIVRETAESLGGRAWVEFPPDGGTAFFFSLPSRRAEDAASAGVRRIPIPSNLVP